MAVPMQKLAERQPRWKPDPGVESFLAKKGVASEYLKDVNISLINVDRSQRNNARVGVAVDPLLVEKYALAMSHGDVFPALAAFMDSDGLYTLAGGNNRLAAAIKTKLKTVDLHLIHANDASLRFLITTKLNDEHGKRPEPDDGPLQAIEWMEKYGHTQEEAADEYRTTRSAIAAIVADRRAFQQLSAAGVAPDTLKKTARVHLARIKNHNAMRAAAALQVQYDLPELMLKEMVGEVRAKGTEAEQLAVVRRWAARDDLKQGRDRRARGLTPKANPNRAELFRVLNSAANLVAKNWSRGLLGLSADDDHRKAVAILRDLLEKLGAME